MSSSTCRHVKADGVYCASPALRGRNYCHFHLSIRAQHYRRMRALSHNEPYQLMLPPLEDLNSVRVALSEVLQALAAGQLDQRTAGLMLYTLQQATSVTRRLDQQQAAQQQQQQEPAATNPSNDAQSAPVEEYPDFERHFDIPPGIDLDAETDRVSRLAEEQFAVQGIVPVPQPGAGCPVPAKLQYTRDEAYQIMQWEVHRLRKQVRELHEEKLQFFKKKPAASVAPETNSVTNTA